MRAYLDRTVWRVKARVRPGEQGRLTLAINVPTADEAGAQARSALLDELLEGMRQAGQPADLLEDVVKKLCALPAGDELDAHVRFVRSKLVTGAYTRSDKSLTVQQLGEAWTSGKLAREHKDHIKAKRSADQDERHLRLYVYEQIGDVPVVAVTLDHLDAVMAKLPEHLGASSRRHVAQVMSTLLKIAVYPLRLIKASPVPKLFLPKVPRSTFTFLYPSEEARLLGCTAVPFLRRLAYGILAREGMRKEELAALRWRDLDLDHGVLSLAYHKTSDETGARAWRLGDDVRQALLLWRPEGAQGDDLVLPGLATNNLAKQLRQDLQSAGVSRPELFEGQGSRRRLRAHDLRATFVTLALACGRGEAWVADRTGHTSGETMARYRRGARTASELELGWLAPLVSVLPELAHKTNADRSCPEPVRNLPVEMQGKPQKPAERAGFEPAVPLRVHMISNPGGAFSPPGLGSFVESSAPSEHPSGQGADRGLVTLSALLEALETADRIARDLDLPQVRVRIAAARQASRLRRVS